MVIEMASYHLGDSGAVYQRFLPGVGPELALELPSDMVALRRRMLGSHSSQAQTLAAFDPHVERFRVAPVYDWAELPNGGRLQYEHWQLGLTGEDWLRFVQEATAELALPTAAQPVAAL